MRSTVLALLAALAFASAAVPQLGVVPSKQRTAAVRSPLAVVIPGDSLAEAVLVDGSVNFLSIYGGVLTLRILLSWFPQAQGVELLRPIFTVSDVYLNLFRGVIPAIGGLDISPIAAFFTLNLLTSSVAALGATGPLDKQPRLAGPAAALIEKVRAQQ